MNLWLDVGYTNNDPIVISTYFVVVIRVVHNAKFYYHISYQKILNPLYKDRVNAVISCQITMLGFPS